jgi:hypothetical protein
LQPADSAAWRNGVTPCPAITSPTNIAAREQVHECRKPRLIGIVDDELMDPSVKQGNRDPAEHRRGVGSQMGHKECRAAPGHRPATHHMTP